MGSKFARAGNPDSNQRAIIEYLRALGCAVHSLTAVGGGCPDLLVGTPPPRRVLILLELKADSKQKLRESQQQFFAHWQNYPLAVVRTLEEAREVVLAYSRPADFETPPVRIEQPAFESEKNSRSKIKKDQDNKFS